MSEIINQRKVLENGYHKVKAKPCYLSSTGLCVLITTNNEVIAFNDLMARKIKGWDDYLSGFLWNMWHINTECQINVFNTTVEIIIPDEKIEFVVKREEVPNKILNSEVQE